MDKTILLDRLNKATDLAASYALQKGLPIAVNKKSVIVGNTIIEKNKSGSYSILSVNRDLLFDDISVFDVAVIVAQRYSSGETGAIKQVLSLEKKFSKYHTDMLYYLHCMKAAKKNKDIERLSILEDKFQVAEIIAKDTRNKISFFKRVK